MNNQIEEADFVLVVCTETYELRFRGKGEAKKGLGAKWGGPIVTQEVYYTGRKNKTFIPVILSQEDAEYIPLMLQGAIYYPANTEEGYDELYRHLTTRPRVVKPEQGIAKHYSGKSPETTTESIYLANIGDQVAKIDRLGFEPYVTAIAKFLTDPNTKPPLTLSIEGEWGSGKSSFMAQLEKDLLSEKCLFNWGKIPGHDEGRLKEFLTQNFDIDWIKTAKIKKNNGIIKVTNGDHFLSLRHNYEKNKVNLKVDDGRTEKITAKTENGELNVYSKKKFTVSFNPWRHDNEDSLWAAFALNFIDELSSKQSFLRRYKSDIKLLISRFSWKNKNESHSLSLWEKLEIVRSLVIWLVFILFSIGALVLLVSKGPDWLNQHNSYSGLKDIVFSAFVGISGGAASIGVLVSLMLKLKNTVRSPFGMDFSEYFNAPDYEDRVDFIENFHKDFENIVKAYAGEDKVYVFIDDLDRCEAPKAADLMQAINLMISYDPHLIFIVGMDREKVAASIAVKHEKLLTYLSSADSGLSVPSRQGLKYGYSFIEKFIQVPFSVPKPTNDDFEKLLEDVSQIAERIDTRSDNQKNLLEENDQYFEVGGAKYSETSGNKREGEYTGDETPEDKAHREEETKIEEKRQTIILELNKDSKRIKDIILMVIPALDNNPRRIKQFINLFRLRIYIAIQTGLFHITKDSPADEHLTPEQLGKFVAISLKWPLLLIDLDADRLLLAKLQKAALDSNSEMKSHWCKEEKLMELLRFGLFKNDSIDTSLGPDEHKYSLSGLNVDKLLQVSPEVAPAERDVDIEDMFDPISINNLASLYHDQGRYQEAEQLYKRVLELMGPDHPDVINSLNNLARLYSDQMKYQEAEQLYKRVLELMGPDHPNVINSLNNLAGLYSDQMKYQEAEQLYKRVLELMGPDHPDVANGLYNLAGLYSDQMKYQEAEQLYKRVLELMGPDHPDVANSLYNLAGLYRDQGRYQEAKPLYMQTIKILEKSVGTEHPHLATLLENYAKLLREMKRDHEAAKMEARAKSIRAQLNPKKDKKRRRKS